MGSERMRDGRIDLTNWCTHFIHLPPPSHNPIVPPYAIADQWYSDIPTFFDDRGMPVVVKVDIEAPRILRPALVSPFDVLRKILADGHIRSSWSFRSRTSIPIAKDWTLRTLGATIYGPYSAVCFTEMPLYAISHYISKHDFVQPYGIAVLRKELFGTGGRPVIYGVTDFRLAQKGDIEFIERAQIISTRTGVGLKEQFRYVTTDLTWQDNSYDWMHEREWRWADTSSDGANYNIPGLGIFNVGTAIEITKCIILVNSELEIARVIEDIIEICSVQTSNEFRYYKREKLLDAKILSFEKINGLLEKDKCLRLDDLEYDSLESARGKWNAEELRNGAK